MALRIKGLGGQFGSPRLDVSKFYAWQKTAIKDEPNGGIRIDLRFLGSTPEPAIGFCAAGVEKKNWSAPIRPA